MNATVSQDEYIDQIRFWRFAMQNLFIINRFEHIELNESVDSIIYNQYKIFDVFVRVFDSKNMISHKAQLEQRARINQVLSKIKTCAKISTKKHTNHSVTIYEFDEHTICSMNTQQIWRSCDMFDEFAMSHKRAIDQQQTINLQLSKKSFFNSIYFLSKDD